jgi:transcriptional regulator
MPDRPLELVKGTLDVLVLRTLSPGPLHGYGISKAIRETSGDALMVEEGALYPALRRLEAKGFLEAEWGTTDTGRDARFYRLTPSGVRQLAVVMRQWDEYVEAMGRVLGGTGRTG